MKNSRTSVISALQSPKGTLPEPGPTAKARLLATFDFDSSGGATDEFGRTLAEAFEDEKTRQPLNLRQRRRAYERGQRTAQRKARRNYVRKEIERQNMATDLAQFFNIIDRPVRARPGIAVSAGAAKGNVVVGNRAVGDDSSISLQSFDGSYTPGNVIVNDRLVPVRPIVRARMTHTIAQKVKQVVDADQARYDREIAARQFDRSLPVPQAPMRHEDVEKQLRGIAKTATIFTPRSSRDPDLVYPFTRAEERTLTTGRTGRAG